MFVLRASNTQICALGLRRFELRFGSSHSFIRTEAAPQQSACEIEISVPCDNGRIKEALLLLDTAQIEVVRGQVRMHEQSFILKVCRTPLCRIYIGLDRLPNSPPKGPVPMMR